MQKRQHYFVAGTDTGVGKTLVSCGLLEAFKRTGVPALGLKPVAAGADETPMGLRNEDAVMLAAASSVSPPYELINPVCLREPASPHIAAALEGRRLSADRIAGMCRGAAATHRGVLLVEGAGGWRVPISERETMADVARVLGHSVILVVGMRLGCLNHALLSAEAIGRDGLVLAGWVANVIDPEMAHLEANIATLVRMLPAPCLGRVPHLGEPAPEQVADALDISLL